MSIKQPISKDYAQVGYICYGLHFYYPFHYHKIGMYVSQYTKQSESTYHTLSPVITTYHTNTEWSPLIPTNFNQSMAPLSFGVGRIYTSLFVYFYVYIF